MKKIMFNDKYRLTRAVLEGRKTMTRRTVPSKIMKDALAYQSHHIDDDEAYVRYILDHAPYKVGEIVAIAQRYVDIIGPDTTDEMFDCYSGAGVINKMFVKAKYMPHHILTTSIRVQSLQGISDEDCMKEGVLSSDKYAMPYGIPDKNGGVFFYYSSPREAFAALIDKVSGKGTWKSNPIALVYEFKLID